MALTYMPDEFGYETNLWMLTFLAELLKQEFCVAVRGRISYV